MPQSPWLTLHTKFLGMVWALFPIVSGCKVHWAQEEERSFQTVVVLSFADGVHTLF